MNHFTNRQKYFPGFLRFPAIATQGYGVFCHDLVEGTVLTQGIMIPYADRVPLLNKNILVT